MCKQTLKEVVKEMCKAYPGGRSAMAAALGISETTFNNKLYEKNGCRFFENDELEAIEDLSGTRKLVEYHAARHDLLLREPIKANVLSHIDLFEKKLSTDAKRGRVDQIIERALEDGEITLNEANEIRQGHREHMTARDDEIESIIILHMRARNK
ncbi:MULTISPECIES: YmfL family putative regulatory protein [unclassified Providencia]|uniref:YmfL family putative regulatory protein n=1 Tax=unclassified Providencia TaxID=2633465 RepID=UPI00234B522D|nr:MULTISPECIES: YmfL family putative regulatory protein [unclassified Providencia]